MWAWDFVTNRNYERYVSPGRRAVGIFINWRGCFSVQYSYWICSMFISNFYLTGSLSFTSILIISYKQTCHFVSLISQEWRYNVFDYVMFTLLLWKWPSSITNRGYCGLTNSRSNSLNLVAGNRSGSTTINCENFINRNLRICMFFFYFYNSINW